MTFETKPEPFYELEPLVSISSSSISQAASIPELISHLKSSFRDKDFSLVQRILMDREKQLQKEIQTIKEYFDSVKKELDDLERGRTLAELEILKLKEQLKVAEEKKRTDQEKMNEMDCRMARLEEEVAKKRDEYVSVIPKIVEDFQVSGASSTGNGSGRSGEEGSGNMDFVATKMNLANIRDALTSHSMPSPCGSVQRNSNVSNKETERRLSEEEDFLPVNLACENRGPIEDLLACEAGDGIKNSLNAVSVRAGSSTVIHISDSDDGNAVACVSNSCGVGRNLSSARQVKKEDIKDCSTSLSKRKRSLTESDNGDGSFGKQKAKSIQELAHDRKQTFVHDLSPKPLFISGCNDKHEGKCFSPLSSRGFDESKFKGFDGSSSDSDDDLCSDKNMEMLIKSKKLLSEDGFRSSLEKDPKLCLNAVCALYRQQISPNISSKGRSFTKREWLSQPDKYSITVLGEYLIDGDPKNKLRKAVAEVRAKDHAECKRLATTYWQQLHQIFLSKEDPLFCPGTILCSF